MNPTNMPFAGTSKKIQFVNAREAYRQDHHRNLFGTDKNTPFAKNKQGKWESSNSAAFGNQGQGQQDASNMEEF